MFIVVIFKANICKVKDWTIITGLDSVQVNQLDQGQSRQVCICMHLVKGPRGGTNRIYRYKPNGFG